MRIFMFALIAFGSVLILVGLVGHLGPYQDKGTRGVNIDLAAHDMSPPERVLFVAVGVGIIFFAGKSLKER